MSAAIQITLKDMHEAMGAPEQIKQLMLDLRKRLAELDHRLEAFPEYRSAFHPVTSPPNSQVILIPAHTR